MSVIMVTCSPSLLHAVPPSVEVSAPSEYGALGSIDITCNSTGVPLPQLMWTFNDQPLESGKDRDQLPVKCGHLCMQ